MRFGQLSAVALASLGFSSVLVSGMSLTCISAAKAANKIPGLLVEHIQKESCEAGCEPKLDHWPAYVKDAVMRPMFQDALQGTGYEESNEAFIESFDKIFDSVASQCSDKLQGHHFCAHPEKLKPFVACAQRAALTNALSASKSVYPYMSDSACTRAAGYFTSSKLWDVDFPNHFKKYVQRCHEL